MSATTSLPSSSRISATTTLAPSRAKIRAMLAPIPDAAPVISATLFSSLIDDPPVAGLDDSNLLPQLAGEQAFRDHRVHPAHDVDDLGDAEADGDARQRIGVERRQLGPRRQKSDRI